MAETLPFNLDETRIIKEGQDGTIIYRGHHEERYIAVKKMPLRKIDLARNEIAVLREHDSHTNVIHYYGYRVDESFVYLALELASGSLHNYVLCPRCREALPPAEVLLQTTRGVAYLHSLHIVHRNLKPSNILFVTLPNRTMIVKISDYAITKTLEDNESFISSTTVGSLSWAAPEARALALGRRPIKEDIFSLGLVFYFMLTEGSRLNGDPPYNLESITNGTQRFLIQAMVSTQPEDRPTAAEVIAHPAFWTPERSVHFIQALSNHAPEGFNFERYREEVFQGNWITILDPRLISQVSKHRRYNGNSFRQLIRMVRNSTNHPTTEMSGPDFIIGSSYKSLLEHLNRRIPNFMYYAWLTGRPLGRDARGVLRALREFYE